MGPDRATARRKDPAWLAVAWADPATQVVVVDDGKALVRSVGGAEELVFVPPAQAPEGVRFLLGTGPPGPPGPGSTAYFGVAGPLPAGPTVGARAADPRGTGVRAAGLRQAGPLLGARDAGLLTQAVALANWHAAYTHCPRCGTRTEPASAGHSRLCPADGSEHFPRVEPAVIMLVTDPAGRCLLARNSRWPEGRVSVLAGFVDAGESAEDAVAREVAEETGIAVGQVSYAGSQPWPMPGSLMLGFRARAAGSLEIRVDSDEIVSAGWYSREVLRDRVQAGTLRLPPPVSIAHRLIEAWYGAALPARSPA